jgi:hypothetical protein
MTQTQWLTVVALAVVAVLIAAVWISQSRRNQSRRLQQRFGPEYHRAVAQFGSRPKAEAELIKRQKRVERLKLLTLAPNEAARFKQAWAVLQGRFVDDPSGAVAEADRLVAELMGKRGYPMSDFEHRAADISVDHPAVIQNYRLAHAVALRDERGEANTEELRKAVVHYRALFDELLEVNAARPVAAPPERKVLART